MSQKLLYADRIFRTETVAKDWAKELITCMLVQSYIGAAKSLQLQMWLT